MQKLQLVFSKVTFICLSIYPNKTVINVKHAKIWSRGE